MSVNAKMGRIVALYEAGAISSEEMRDAEAAMKLGRGLEDLPTEFAADLMDGCAEPQRDKRAFGGAVQVIGLGSVTALVMNQAGVPLELVLGCATCALVAAGVSMMSSRRTV
ncbi:MAG: hypothetical protein AAGF74_04685 [Pseudomonadota bacterium]